MRTLLLLLLTAIPAFAQAPALTLPELTKLTLEKHPRLAQAVFTVDAVRGKAMQAGMYPNPTVLLSFDELGDRTGQRGINSLPQVTQEIVLYDKLKLSRAAVMKEVDQATLAQSALAYTVLAGVRAAYFDCLVTQHRVEIAEALVKIAEQAVAQSQKLLAAGQTSKLDLLQFEVELERLKADRDATLKELPAAYRKLATAVGVNELPIGSVAGVIDQPLPPYELDRTVKLVLSIHPDVTAAHAGVERARILQKRAEVEPRPNVSVSSGYVRQNQNKSNDWMLAFSVPLPVWNRNPGGILTAKANVGEAVQEVARVENELADKVATAFREFAAAKERAERYRTAILPKAREGLALAMQSYQGGQIEYLKVLQAQQSVNAIALEALKATGDAWKAASALSGMTLEDDWPFVPAK